MFVTHIKTRSKKTSQQNRGITERSEYMPRKSVYLDFDRVSLTIEHDGEYLKSCISGIMSINFHE